MRDVSEKGGRDSFSIWNDNTHANDDIDLVIHETEDTNKATNMSQSISFKVIISLHV